jgi:pimeloyl-ACP methyl ester carboxylesterase
MYDSSSLKQPLTAGVSANPLLWVEYVSAGLLLGAVVGTIVCASFLWNPGPVLMQDMAPDIWICALLTFFAFQTIHHARKRLEDVLNFFSVQVAYHSLSAAISFAMAICFAIFGRWDQFLLSLLLVLSNILSVVVLWSRHATVGPSHAQALSAEELRLGAGGVWWAKLEGVSCASRTWACWNVMNSCCVGAFLVLLLNGSIIQANGIVQWPPRGEFMTVHLADANRDARLLYYCEGPKNASFPTYLIEADASHGLADFWPLQRALTEAGRRSCIYDKLGLGHSDSYPADSKADPMIFYDQFVEGLEKVGETMPLIIVGEGGGGIIAYQYALEKPERVAGLAFIMTFSDGIEFRVEQYLNNWDEQQMLAYRDEDLAGRFFLFQIIRVLGCPWGVMDAALPSTDKYAWLERYAEYRWFYITRRCGGCGVVGWGAGEAWGRAVAFRGPLRPQFRTVCTHTTIHPPLPPIPGQSQPEHGQRNGIHCRCRRTKSWRSTTGACSTRPTPPSTDFPSSRSSGTAPTPKSARTKTSAPTPRPAPLL